MKAGSWILERREINGYWLIAPTTYWNATREEIEAKAGGCGPGKIGDWIVPDTMYGEKVTPACEIHDWMYDEGIDLADKKIADRTLQWNLSVLIQEEPYTNESEHQLLDRPRLHRATLYYIMVYYHGGDAFEKGETLKSKDAERINYEDYEDFC